jgi:hypothetical protein
METNTTLDAMDGDRITVERFHKGHTALLTLEEYEDEDSPLIETASVLLRPIQLRALATLCLIAAEELERES